MTGTATAEPEGRTRSHAAPRAPFLRRLVRPLAVGAALRAAWALWLLGVNDPVSDCSVYHEGARGLARGAGFVFASGDPNGYWPVGYSALLAPFYALAGPSFGVAYAVNLALGLALVVVLAYLARRLYGASAGVAAAWIVALYPSFVLYTTVIASENLYLPLLGAFALATVGVEERADRRSAAAPWLGTGAMGLLLGALVLVRPTALALPLLVPLGTRLRGATWGFGLVRVALVVALAVSVCVPWGLRNQRVFGEFTLSSFNGGAVLWMGNHDGPPTTDTPERYRHLGIVEKHHALQAEAIAYIRAHPEVFLARTVTRSATALATETIAVVWNENGVRARLGEAGFAPLKLLTSVAWWALAALFLLALVTRVRDRKRVGLQRELWQLAGCVAGAAPFVVFDSQNRYHFPLLPFMVPLAAALVASWAARRAARPFSAAAAPASDAAAR